MGRQDGGSIINNHVNDLVCSGGNCADATRDDVFIGNPFGGSRSNNFFNSTTTGWASSSSALKKSSADLAEDTAPADNVSDVMVALSFNAGVWDVDPAVFASGHPLLNWQ